MRTRDPVATGVLIALAVIAILLFLWFLTRIGPILMTALVAIILAAGIAPVVDRMSNAKLPPGGWSLPTSVSILLVYVGLVVVAGAIVLLVGSVVVRESIQLANNAPEYYASATNAFARLQERYDWLPNMTDILRRLQNQAGAISSYAYRAATSVVGFLGNIVVIVTVFVLSYYILVSRESIRRNALRLIPASSREEYGKTFSEMGMKMGSWLRAQVLLALTVGGAIALVLWLIGVPYAFIIAVIGAVAELIPMLGPGIAAIPAVLLMIFQPTWQLVLVIVFFVILATLEGNYLAPKLMEQQVGVSPIITIIALLIGASVAGFLGALLAIPLAAAFQVFINRRILPAVEEAENDAGTRG